MDLMIEEVGERGFTFGSLNFFHHILMHGMRRLPVVKGKV